VDGAHGFLPELVIKGPDTIPEFGGGLCQVSTTMFRAALLSGLPILERRNHSYAVSYYVWPMGWGFDATVYIGAVDMKFKNDTPGDIIVQAYTEGTRVYYKFYGIRDSRQTLISNSVITGRSGPPAAIVQYTSALAPGKTRIKEKAHAGLSAYFTRTVTMPDGTVKKEKITSVYQARPQVTLAGGTDAPSDTDIYYTGDIAP
jgi:vancomycin resistance protein YoaR